MYCEPPGRNPAEVKELIRWGSENPFLYVHWVWSEMELTQWVKVQLNPYEDGIHGVNLLIHPEDFYEALTTSDFNYFWELAEGGIIGFKELENE